MISAKFLLGNIFFGEKLQIDAKISNFEISEYAFKFRVISACNIYFILQLQFVWIQVYRDTNARTKWNKTSSFQFLGFSTGYIGSLR